MSELANHIRYRPEVDGLRALAVIPVILFHAGFELFSGGFVGVDIFFVISGYLITTILLVEKSAGRFSIVGFYERRARRILPALFFVILACLPFAWLWMTPDRLREFSQSIVAVTVFASNVLFWKSSGYFDASAEEKPLLHTWSLGVEEQYYLLFPLFLILTWRLGRKNQAWLILSMATISLALCEWAWRNHPMANFYLAPTRAWELLIGSLLAFAAFDRPLYQRVTERLADALSFFGMLLVFWSIFYFDKTTPFPSLFALAPILGTALILGFSGAKTIAAKLLSTKWVVAIGLISYSAYLWHQPLFAFARLRSTESPSLLVFFDSKRRRLAPRIFELALCGNAVQESQKNHARTNFHTICDHLADLYVYRFGGRTHGGFSEPLKRSGTVHAQDGKTQSQTFHLPYDGRRFSRSSQGMRVL